MTSASDLREFLTTRRARLSPELAGLPTYGRHRRVPGLRREEVALLAGISIDYYTRLERGNAQGVSEDVLAAVARALRLDDDERAHLHDLVRLTRDGMAVGPRGSGGRGIRPGVRRIIDGMTTMPALLRNRRLDILHANALGRALHAEVYEGGSGPPNPARYVFLDPRSRTFYVDWDRAANDMAALLRSEVARSRDDAALAALIDELMSGSADFRRRWAAHDVLFHRHGTASFRHPVVGLLVLSYEDLDLPTDRDQTVLVFTAEPGSASAEALSRLAATAPQPRDTDEGDGSPG